MIVIKSMLANAVFSATSASLMYVYQGELTQLIPLNSLIWTIISIGLLLFSVQLLMLSLNRAWARKFVNVIIQSDYAWVILSSFAALYFYQTLEVLAWLIIMGVNILVLVLARWQKSEIGYI